MKDYNPFSLEGKTILVTGASSGIGRTAAIECSKMGAKIIATARNEQRLNETIENLKGEGHQAIICDLTNEASLDNMISVLPEIQGLINNAGISILLPVKFVNSENLKSVLDVNTFAPIILLQKLLKKKKIRKGASIVFTSSISGLGTSAVGSSMYAASKGAICSFIRCAALELAPQNIRVNSVCPAMVNTDLLDILPTSDEEKNEELNNYPLGRLGNPCDVAHAMIYLLSDASSWVTGDNLVIDGGLTLK